MERIKSFTVDHMKLLPGIYLSRADEISAFDAYNRLDEPVVPHEQCDKKSLYTVSTYDIRMTRPNFEPVMGTGEIHTIEHLGATYLRNRKDIQYRILYWGPMGCRTGFYLIMAGSIPVEDIKKLMIEMYEFIAAFEGDIPGASPVECGNYSDMDLDGAKKRAVKYLEILKNE